MADTNQAIEMLVRGVICNMGHVLVARMHGSSVSHLPGGHIEPGEAAAVALARELKEELGLAVRVGQFLGAVEHTYAQDGVSKHEFNVVFEVIANSLDAAETPPSNEPDLLSFEWIRIDALEESDLEPEPLRGLIAKWLFVPGGNFASTLISTKLF